MIRSSVLKLCVVTLLVGSLSPTPGRAVPANGMGHPAVRVSLHPSVTGVAPGTALEVALQFHIPDQWHTYWQNPGDSGLPLQVTWRLPPGFEVGELRFPVPQRHLGPGSLITNVLQGRPVLIQSLVAPKTVKPGETVTLTADLKWLICKTSCIPGRDSVAVELPVVGSPAEVQPANETVFEQARRALPIPPHKSKHVTVAPSTTARTVKPGQTFEVLLELVVAAGNHVQSNRPPRAVLIPTHVFLERVPGLDLGKPIYPRPEERKHPQWGPVSEYRGRVPIRIPVQVRDDAEGPRVRISGIVTAQVCNDQTGTCYPPEHVQWELELPLDRSAATASAGSEGGPLTQTETQTEPPVPAELEMEDTADDGDGLHSFLARLGLPGLLLGCFLYGLFINATPCVLPLLSIKVLGFVQQAHESRRRTLLLGLSFGAGVVLFFVMLGFLAAAGKNVLQYPVAVIALGAVVMALALSMLGVYTLQVPSTATKLDAALQKEGLLSSFGKGALAPVLGFACTGPLLAGVFGWATQQPPNIAVLAFVFAGLGMAFPYVLLGANPNWLGFLPKPGPWMVTFERIMGFLLLGMVVWLLHPLITHIGAEGLEWTLAFLVVLAFACWLLGRIDVNMSTAQRWRYRGAAAGLVMVTGVLVYGFIYPLSKAKGKLHYAGRDDWSSGIPWRPWSVRETVRSGKTVFLDFTAAYCTVCKQNKAVAANTPDVRAKMRELGVVPVQGDFTSGEPEIAAMLKKYHRSGVPLNLIYPAGKPDEPIVLRTNLTKQYLLEKLEEAGPSGDAPRTRPDS